MSHFFGLNVGFSAGGNFSDIVIGFRSPANSGLCDQNMLTGPEDSDSLVPAFQACQAHMVATCNSTQGIASAHRVPDCIQHALVSGGEQRIEGGKFGFSCFMEEKELLMH